MNEKNSAFCWQLCAWSGGADRWCSKVGAKQKWESCRPVLNLHPLHAVQVHYGQDNGNQEDDEAAHAHADVEDLGGSGGWAHFVHCCWQIDRQSYFSNSKSEGPETFKIHHECENTILPTLFVIKHFKSISNLSYYFMTLKLDTFNFNPQKMTVFCLYIVYI